MITKEDKREMMNIVRTAVRNAMESQEERWLSEKEFLDTFQMFNARWLKSYGVLLPRAKMTVIDKNGMPHFTRYAYPMHKINNMIANNQITFKL